MSQRIARLLDEPERQVTKLVNGLEDKNGYPSHDARFLAETVQKIRLKLGDLSLDPDDTTAQELYHALQVKFDHDSRLFDEYFGAVSYDFDQKSAKAIQLLQTHAGEARQWGLKTKAAKDVLRQLPPKRVMKHLNYRSVDSLLKRESLSGIYLALSYIESGSWLKAHKRIVSKLDQTAFEVREVAFVNMSSDKWRNISGPSDFIARNEEIAAAAIWPSDKTANASLLSMVLMQADELAKHSGVEASRTTAHLNGIVAWWADMDHLVTELSGEPVSLSLRDCSANHLKNNLFEERSLKHGRASFWRELVGRYENLPATDGLFDESVKQRVAGLKLLGPEPAYEFVEDF